MHALPRARSIHPLGGHSAGFLTAVMLVLAAWCFLGCAPGTVTTSTGQVVPAGTVIAQDIAADTLKTLDDAYKAAVAKHDAAFGIEGPAPHAAHRKILDAALAGLRGSWDALIAWKASSVGAAPPNVLQPVVAAARDFIPMAVQLGAVPQATADKILGYINSVFPPGVP